MATNSFPCNENGLIEAKHCKMLGIRPNEEKCKAQLADSIFHWKSNVKMGNSIGDNNHIYTIDRWLIIHNWCRSVLDASVYSKFASSLKHLHEDLARTFSESPQASYPKLKPLGVTYLLLLLTHEKLTLFLSWRDTSWVARLEHLLSSNEILVLLIGLHPRKESYEQLQLVFLVIKTILLDE